MSEPRFENLLALNPAQILVPTKPGPEDASPVYEAVGMALSAWERLEEELCRLFGMYLGTISQAAKRAYGSVVSAKARISMLENAIQETYGFMSPETAKLHLKAMSKVGILAGRRNEIAHGKVTNMTINEERFGCCLFPANYNSGKTYSSGEYFTRIDEKSPHSEWLTIALAENKYVYTHREIAAYTSMFATAANDLQKMHLHLFLQLCESQKREPSNGGVRIQMTAEDPDPTA